MSVARLVAGDDVCEIARDAGVAEATVYEWVKQAGALPPMKALALQREQLIDERSVATQGRSERGAERCLATWFSAAMGQLPRGACPPERCGETSPQDEPARSHVTCGTMSPNQTLPGAQITALSRHFTGRGDALRPKLDALRPKLTA